MKALVTGGGGFLGRAIVERLLARGDQVRSFARGDYPALRELGVQVIQGDLTDVASVADACDGVDAVFHVAAKPGIWGSRDSFYGPNVVGTENVIKSCRAHGVRRLVYTSSPSVVFGGTDLEGVNEDVAYPTRYHAHYPETKAIAERLVVAANGPELATVSLRPHLIWGPGDNHLVPRILARGRAGKLRRVGAGTNKVDSIYIDNAADAHLLAADRLAPGSAVAGKIYFLSNGEPLELSTLINGILAAGNLPPMQRSVSVGVARLAGSCLETAYRIFNIAGEPVMTRFLAEELGTAHWFDISQARRDLGYAPRVTIEEGLKRLGRWLHAERDCASSASPVKVKL
ncbi:MAG: NAD-dependent epimerase/dehydratase family protein [Deltaproteobacteria bacterium]|nr:NAD-dependent epimerase/dehydratase family protein [Deltaproteobacteria bacterium]